MVQNANDLQGSEMIEPTIGRVVWYHPKPSAGDPIPLFPEQPYVALIAGIAPSGLLNLTVSSHAGYTFAKQGVRLAQDPPEGSWEIPIEQGDAEWMPFQKGQAAKQTVSPSDLADLRTDVDQIGLLLSEKLNKLRAAIGSPGAPPNDSGPQSIEFRLNALELVAQAGSSIVKPETLDALRAKIAELTAPPEAHAE